MIASNFISTADVYHMKLTARTLMFSGLLPSFNILEQKYDVSGTCQFFWVRQKLIPIYSTKRSGYFQLNTGAKLPKRRTFGSECKMVDRVQKKAILNTFQLYYSMRQNEKIIIAQLLMKFPAFMEPESSFPSSRARYWPC
jgi:hypothetical protein